MALARHQTATTIWQPQFFQALVAFPFPLLFQVELAKKAGALYRALQPLPSTPRLPVCLARGICDSLSQAKWRGLPAALERYLSARENKAQFVWHIHALQNQPLSNLGKPDKTLRRTTQQVLQTSNQ